MVGNVNNSVRILDYIPVLRLHIVFIQAVISNDRHWTIFGLVDWCRFVAGKHLQVKKYNKKQQNDKRFFISPAQINPLLRKEIVRKIKNIIKDFFLKKLFLTGKNWFLSISFSFFLKTWYALSIEGIKTGRYKRCFKNYNNCFKRIKFVP